MYDQLYILGIAFITSVIGFLFAKRKIRKAKIKLQNYSQTLEDTTEMEGKFLEARSSCVQRMVDINNWVREIGEIQSKY